MDDCRAAIFYFFPVVSILYAAIPVLYLVIPAKAGIHTVAAKLAIRNQVQTSSQRIPSPFMGLQG